MKKCELSEILNTIENFKAREKRYCAEYSALNPGDAERRKRDAELIIFAADMLWTELHAIAKTE